MARKKSETPKKQPQPPDKKIGFDTTETRKKGAQPDNLNAMKSGFYSRRFTDEELIEIGKLAVADLTLGEEIGLLRVLMLRVLDSNLGVEKTIDILGRATGQLRRLVQTRSELLNAGETESAIAKATDRALDELSEMLGVEL